MNAEQVVQKMLSFLVFQQVKIDLLTERVDALQAEREGGTPEEAEARSKALFLDYYRENRARVAAKMSNFMGIPLDSETKLLLGPDDDFNDWLRKQSGP